VCALYRFAVRIAPYYAGSVLNRLREARKQLPKSGPGYIFLFLPEEFINNNQQSLENGIYSFFRNTARINSIIYVWHEWQPLNNGQASIMKFRQLDSPNPRTPIYLGPIIQKIDLPTYPNPEPQLFRPSFW
jgi:hypothetical protein